MNILHFMEIMVYNYGKTKSKEDRTKILRKGACQILLIGFFPLRAVSLGDAANFLISTFGNLFSP